MLKFLRREQNLAKESCRFSGNLCVGGEQTKETEEGTKEHLDFIMIYHSDQLHLSENMCISYNREVRKRGRGKFRWRDDF